VLKKNTLCEGTPTVEADYHAQGPGRRLCRAASGAITSLQPYATPSLMGLPWPRQTPYHHSAGQHCSLCMILNMISQLSWAHQRGTHPDRAMCCSLSEVIWHDTTKEAHNSNTPRRATQVSDVSWTAPATPQGLLLLSHYAPRASNPAGVHSLMRGAVERKPYHFKT
jgi:hypothetical protein